MGLQPEKMTPHQSSQALALIFKMFQAKDVNEARIFFEHAIQSIYGEEKLTPVTLLQQFDWAYALIKMFNPKEEFEAVLCAQYVLCHILGMHKINQPNFLDQRIAIRLIKLSNIALERLQNKRKGTLLSSSKEGNYGRKKTMRS